ncbi:hypothetical protein HQQ81_18755 [Microbacteriaceae bacterium VKM Ac-2854]|nr:hypothetical protein [Microbacteriaceae bacterium VKM Ac-2854]
MKLSRRARSIATIVAVGAFAFAAATPALADHNAGANLDDFALIGDIGNDQSCYYGALLSGSPDLDLVTSDYVYKRTGSSLTLICYFSGIPSFVPAGEFGVKGDWYAPKTPKRYVEQSKCLPPGTDSAGEEIPDGNGGYQGVDAADANTVFYKSTMVMVCHWPDDPTR